MAPGRRSAAEASVLRLAPKRVRRGLSPPVPLTKPEQAIFDAVATANPHLTQGDAVMLAAYAQAATKTMKLARTGPVGDWERAGRLMMSLATKMRISAQSTQDPQVLGRRKKDTEAFGGLRKPWEGYGGDSDEDWPPSDLGQ